MAELHSLLRRQLKRHFPDDRVPEELTAFLAAIDQAYYQFDNDRSMLERSLDLSSQELIQINNELRKAQRDLEHRVEERTAALGRANDELRREISERQAAESARGQLEEQLRHAQKMEAIGRLSGGIAHDFNNLLTAISGYSELLMKELDGSPLKADAEEIHNAADRAATLTGQLLAFSRRQILSPEVVVLNQRVADLSRMLNRLIGEHIAIDLRLASNLWPVRADVAHLEQALVNLALNARDAMPHGGRLGIETANRDIGEQEAQALEIAAGPFVELRVRDTGVGIAPDLKARIFEPFFTTKLKGAGTGLGLSMVYGFVRQSGGAIDVDSAPGEGSTFSLLLPRTEETDSVAHVSRSERPRTERGSGTVLIAEDERALRRLSANVLGQAGYRTLEAADGQQALDLFQVHAFSVVMVVTDVVMPRMGGIELARRLRKSRPDLPILFVTGYVEKSESLHESAAGTPVLLKPFAPEALLRAVSSAIQAGRK